MLKNVYLVRIHS